MSYLPKRLAAAALAAAAGGTLLVPASPAAAAAAPPAAARAATAAAARTAAAPPRNFRYDVYFPKYTHRGGYLTYTVKVRNKSAKGQHYLALTGDFSRAFRAVKVIAKPRSVKCSTKGRTVRCLVTSLDKGDSTTVKIRGWVVRRRGTAVARFGAAVTSDRHVSLGALAKTIRSRVTAKSKVR
ncbi:hypothetical protein [Streptosporangium pseudovulgare]|uniref:DUF11 domain-containing protein n=1 Tax=Streptosporangium pseudovulgare TaxID=35765 RepID=A0ABQ2R5E4_9ACTN|nr:hypothetical protein [Streptosporangium pseudovulgare]GGQ09974.1 hypothetical protein GCM10010140_45350 [Streptosporangium pseudovulgare]